MPRRARLRSPGITVLVARSSLAVRRAGTSVTDELAAIDALDTGTRGGPEPEDITLEAFGPDIPEA